jgi:RNA processing factor Prp31
MVWDWISFSEKLLATLIGVIIGIPVAFWVDRLRKNSENLSKKKNLLNFLLKNLEKNLSLIQQAKKELPSHIIFYNLDLGAWTNLSNTLPILENDDLMRKILYVYYELEHISRKIDRQFDMHYSVSRAMGDYKEQRSELVNATISHIDKLEKEINELIQIIKSDQQPLDIHT